MTPVVRAKDVFYLYRAPHGDIAALRGLSLDVGPSEVIAVLGPSGSGKTTLLSLCAGFARPTSGELSVVGQSFGAVSTKQTTFVRRNAIGIVRQHYHLSLPRELTALQIVALPLRLIGEARQPAELRAWELLRAAGLEERVDARPTELSGGEQQRVAVCAALAKRPALLLADEPTGELDRANSHAVLDLLVGLATSENTAALVVTHDPEVALRADRTIHIRDGRLAAEGTSRPVLILDEQGWLRLPRHLRDRAGIKDRVRASATWGKVELLADHPGQQLPPPQPATPARVAAGAKRFETEIALDRVTKHHGTAGPVVRELTWTFAPEALHVIAGPSGSGKTTLLNVIGALDYPDGGEVWVGGERVDALGPDEAARWRQRSVGYLSQHSTLAEFLTARENVALALVLRGFEEAEADRRANRWLEWVGLGRQADRRGDRLSGGEQRRVALARALAPEPRVLLADEPTAHLDQMTARIVIRLLQQAAHERGTTILSATHDVDLVAAADTTLDLAHLARARALNTTGSSTRCRDVPARARDAGSRRGRRPGSS